MRTQSRLGGGVPLRPGEAALRSFERERSRRTSRSRGRSRSLLMLRSRRFGDDELRRFGEGEARLLGEGDPRLLGESGVRRRRRSGLGERRDEATVAFSPRSARACARGERERRTGLLFRSANVKF